MSFSEALGQGNKILPQYIDNTGIIIPITQVSSLQTNLNLLNLELEAVTNKQHFAEFYALMPPDNAVAVAVGDSIDFPRDGLFFGDSIERSGSSDFEFLLKAIGTYKITFQASIAQAGQLGILLNGALVTKSIVGKASTGGQLFCSCLVNSTVVDSTLSIVNPLGNVGSLTLTVSAGGASAVSANLLIERLF
jgi:hypothetical protein